METMTSRERVFNTLNHQPVDRIPRTVWALPSVPMFRMDDFLALTKDFHMDISGPDFAYAPSGRESGVPARIGHYTDAYGIGWNVTEDGIIGEVTAPVIKDYSDLKTYEFPHVMIDKADYSRVDSSCKSSDQFMIAGSLVRPFELMQFMRGTETLFMDMALEEEGFFELREKIHQFFLKDIKNWAGAAVDAVSMMDDWGTQRSLLIDPAMWRRYYKPLYKEYCDILHAAGKKVFFHSDGFIEAIYPDLIEVGFDAVNSQLFCMDIERLTAEYGKQITFWGEIDRQYIVPFGTEAEVRAAVDRVADAAFKNGRTGVIAQCEFGRIDPIENVRAVFDQWNTK